MLTAIFGLRPLIIAEGACNGLTLIQCGFPRVIAVPGWSERSADPKDYAPFERHEERIKRAKKIVVAKHADNAGAAMLRGIANFFDGCDVGYTTWPEGCGDANDCLLHGGAEAVVRAISSAHQVTPPGGLITGKRTPVAVNANANTAESLFLSVARISPGRLKVLDALIIQRSAWLDRRWQLAHRQSCRWPV